MCMSIPNDSGGPVFLGPYSSNLVVAVTSFTIGNTMYRGTNFAYRLDSAEVQAWIEETVGPELWAQIAP